MFFSAKEDSPRGATLIFCKFNGFDSDPQPPEGYTQKQEMLAKIAMLQTQIVCFSDYLDERSSYLTQFVEEANAEFDQIAENALKELDETSARVCSTSYSPMHTETGFLQKSSFR